MSARARRSPAYLGEPTVKFRPIVPDGLSDRELLEQAVGGINDLHTCFDSHRTEQARRDQAADQKRGVMVSEIASLGGSVATLGREVGGLRTDQDSANGQLAKLSKALGLQPKAKGEKIKASWRAQPKWKIATTVLGSVGGAVMVIQIAAPAIVAGAQAFWTSLMAAH